MELFRNEHNILHDPFPKKTEKNQCNFHIQFIKFTSQLLVELSTDQPFAVTFNNVTSTVLFKSSFIQNNKEIKAAMSN